MNGEKGNFFNCKQVSLNVMFRRNSYNFKRTEQAETKVFAESSSEQERKVNALASGADEGRDKLR